jgi:hypothetical protein
MKNIVNIGGAALASIALAGCGQRDDTDDQRVSEQSQNADGAVGTGEDLNDVAPALDPDAQPQLDELGDEPMSNDDTLVKRPGFSGGGFI